MRYLVAFKTLNHSTMHVYLFSKGKGIFFFATAGKVSTSITLTSQFMLSLFFNADAMIVSAKIEYESSCRSYVKTLGWIVWDLMAIGNL